MISRFFCPGPLREGEEVALPKGVGHHAERVLRLAVGDPVVLFDGEGAQFSATLSALGGVPRALVGQRETPTTESPLALTLVQGLAASDKMDWIIQKAVELGVAAIVPVAAERSVLQLSGERAEKRLAHWRQVAVAACEQCGRNRLPTVAPVRSLGEALEAAGENRLRWVLDPAADISLTAMMPPDGPLSLFIGPESGWSARELERLQRAGGRGVRLGPRVLRTETAGLAALAAIQARWGDF
ncbi:MAG: 16S rRNA (uracil(1498)-N(3))-methyltransferase [Zoogloeaceae bacterium]|nr:16S rRNA (uracil(1498)-N(3))-methyltransferase [Zoogloeaceae bacterium]